VNPADLSLSDALQGYAAGLEAELALLGQLDTLAGRLREVTDSNDVDALHRHTDERSRLLEGLVALERDLRPLRQRLSDAHVEARRLPGFASVVGRHRQAGLLVNRILSLDQRSLDALRDAEQARRFAAQTIEAAESTLAAYRRVVSPPPTSAAIVDDRG
jgi:hypothetical protein